MENIEQALADCLRKLVDINSQNSDYLNSSQNHVDADDALVQFFRDIGRDDIADEYERVEPKWYE